MLLLLGVVQQLTRFRLTYDSASRGLSAIAELLVFTYLAQWRN